jgi:hypothetical protein
MLLNIAQLDNHMINMVNLRRLPTKIPLIATGWWLTYPSEKYESQLG